MRASSRKKAEGICVLDAYSLLAFLEAEKGGEKVKELLETPGFRFYVSVVHHGRVESEFGIGLMDKGLE